VTLGRSLRVLCALAIVATAAGCVRFNYSWLSLYEPVEQARIDELGTELAVGAVPLQQCLDELGAPVLVWETPRGLALAYGWKDEGSWTFHIGYVWQFVFRAQFDYTSASSDLEGLVLWFDDDLRLVTIERGRLSDLVPTERQRASATADAE
jgi:hypothetical protein